MRLISVQKRNALDRKGFTLIELLVVITIIVILMALTLGVISKIYVFLDETKTVADVNRLAQGCSQFKVSFGRYPPAKIMLCENPAHYAGFFAPGSAQQVLASYSAEYISSVFPGLLNSPSSVTNGIDWSGFGVNTASPRDFLLEGEESLVYFLGGVRPNGGAPVGFNTDKTQLTIVTTGARLGPFFEFDASRLVASPNALSLGLFQVYRDVYGTPYAYFLPRTPGMNNYFHPGAPQMLGFSAANQQMLSDCFSLTGNYVPMWKQALPSSAPFVAINYQKADSFQIVCAGKDKQFGCGGLWNQTDPEQSQFDFMSNSPSLAPLAGTATVPDKQANYDNISNVTNGRVVPK